MELRQHQTTNQQQLQHHHAQPDGNTDNGTGGTCASGKLSWTWKHNCANSRSATQSLMQKGDSPTQAVGFGTRRTSDLDNEMTGISARVQGRFPGSPYQDMCRARGVV